jgi:hypothetical protein
MRSFPRDPSLRLSRVLDNRNYLDRLVMPTWLSLTVGSAADTLWPVMSWSG